MKIGVVGKGDSITKGETERVVKKWRINNERREEE